MALACNNKDGKKENGKSDTTATEVVEKPVVYDRSLPGKWKPVKVEIADMSEADKQDLLNNAVIEFTTDGQFLTTMKDKTNTGTYVFSEQDSKLMTRTSSDREENFSISWDKDLLKLTNDEGTVTMKKL
jgi:hypothetical protein